VFEVILLAHTPVKCTLQEGKGGVHMALNKAHAVFQEEVHQEATEENKGNSARATIMATSTEPACDGCRLLVLESAVGFLHCDCSAA